MLPGNTPEMLKKGAFTTYFRADPAKSNHWGAQNHDATKLAPRGGVSPRPYAQSTQEQRRHVCQHSRAFGSQLAACAVKAG